MIEPVSEDTILITLAPAIDDTLPARIASLVDNIWRAGFHWLVDMVPSYTTLMVVYDPVAVDFRQASAELRPLVHRLSTEAHVYSCRTNHRGKARTRAACGQLRWRAPPRSQQR